MARTSGIAVLVLVALVGPAAAEGDLLPPNQSLDAPVLDTGTLPRVCQDELDRTGGFILWSRLAARCQAIGVAGFFRDLADDELARVQTWCPRDADGPACTSLQHVCDRYGARTDLPNLTVACVAMARAHPRPAKAPPDPGVDDLWLGLAVGHVDEPAQLDDTTTTIAAELEMNGLIGLHQIAPALSMHGAAGSTTGGGFLYDLSVGLGVGLRIGADGLLAVTIGGGFGGITGGRLGFAWLVPIAATAAIPLGKALRLVVGGRGAFVFREDDRQDGATAVPIYDEVSLRLGLALQRPSGALIGLYAFASDLRETSIIGLALATGQVQVETGDRPVDPD